MGQHTEGTVARVNEREIPHEIHGVCQIEAGILRVKFEPHEVEAPHIDGGHRVADAEVERAVETEVVVNRQT